MSLFIVWIVGDIVLILFLFDRSVMFIEFRLVMLFMFFFFVSVVRVLFRVLSFLLMLGFMWILILYIFYNILSV